MCAKCHEIGSELAEDSFALVDDFNVNLNVYRPELVFYVI